MRRWRMQVEAAADEPPRAGVAFGRGNAAAAPKGKKAAAPKGAKDAQQQRPYEGRLMTKAAQEKHKKDYLVRLRQEAAAAEEQLARENAAVRDLQAQLVDQAEEALARERAAVRLMQREREQERRRHADVAPPAAKDADLPPPVVVGAGPMRLVRELRLQVADPAGDAPDRGAGGNDGGNGDAAPDARAAARGRRDDDVHHDRPNNHEQPPQQREHAHATSPAKGRGGGFLSSVSAMHEGSDEALKRLQEKERQRNAYRAELEEQVRAKQAQRQNEKGPRRGRRMDGAAAAAAATPFIAIPEDATAEPVELEPPDHGRIAARAAETPGSVVSAAPTPRSVASERSDLGPASPARQRGGAFGPPSPASRPGGFLSSVAVMHRDQDEAVRELRDREERQRAYALELEAQMQERKEREERRKAELRELELKEEMELQEQARRAAKGFASSVPGLRPEEQEAGRNDGADDTAAAAPGTPERVPGGWPSAAQEMDASESGFANRGRRGEPSPAPPAQVIARALPPPAESFGRPGGAADGAPAESIAGLIGAAANAAPVVAAAAMPAAAVEAGGGGIGPSGLDALARLLEQQASEAAALRQEARAAQREREAMRKEMEELKQAAHAAQVAAQAAQHQSGGGGTAGVPGLGAPVRDSLDGFSVESKWIPADAHLAPFGTGFWEAARNSVSSHGDDGLRGGRSRLGDEEAPAPPRRDTHSSPAKPRAGRRASGNAQRGGGGNGGGGRREHDDDNEGDDMRAELLENERRRKQLMKAKRGKGRDQDAWRKPPARWR